MIENSENSTANVNTFIANVNTFIANDQCEYEAQCCDHCLEPVCSISRTTRRFGIDFLQISD